MQQRAGNEHTLGPRIVDDVARDVGQLERQSEVRRAVERLCVTHAHHMRHHDADDPGDVVAVVEHVIDRSVVAPVHVHLEPVEVMFGVAVRDVVRGEDPRHARKLRRNGAACKRVGRQFA